MGVSLQSSVSTNTWPSAELYSSHQMSSPPPQVEGLMDDIDFKAKVTRAEFENLCADLFERVPQPVKDALSTAEMTMVSLVTCHLLVAWRFLQRFHIVFCL